MKRPQQYSQIQENPASGFTPGIFQGVYFELYISSVHYFGIIIKEKCSPLNQGIIQQTIMHINKVISHMTELSDPSSYLLRPPRVQQCTFPGYVVVHALVYL